MKKLRTNKLLKKITFTTLLLAFFLISCEVENFETNVETTKEDEDNIEVTIDNIQLNNENFFKLGINDGQSQTKKVIIKNNNDYTVKLTGDPLLQLNIIHGDINDFTIDSTNLCSVLESGKDTFFYINFNPANKELKSAKITIPTDDDEIQIKLTSTGIMEYTSGTHTFTCEYDGLVADITLIGGGGGGGGSDLHGSNICYGGGGGAGAVENITDFKLHKGLTYTIVVGSGGGGSGYDSGDGSPGNPSYINSNGICLLTASGGGGGSYHTENSGERNGKSNGTGYGRGGDGGNNNGQNSGATGGTGYIKIEWGAE